MFCSKAQKIILKLKNQVKNMQINETANNIKKMHSFEMYPRIRQMKIYLVECPGRNLLGLHHLLILALLKNGLKLKVRVFGFKC